MRNDTTISVSKKNFEILRSLHLINNAKYPSKNAILEEALIDHLEKIEKEGKLKQYIKRFPELKKYVDDLRKRNQTKNKKLEKNIKE